MSNILAASAPAYSFIDTMPEEDRIAERLKWAISALKAAQRLHGMRSTGALADQLSGSQLHEAASDMNGAASAFNNQIIDVLADLSADLAIAAASK